MKCMSRFLSVFTVTLSLSSACSDSKFSSSPAKTTSSPANADATEVSDSPKPEAEPENEVSEVASPPINPSQSIVLPDGDREALDECISKFGDHPFGASEIGNPYVVNISDSVNNNGIIFADNKATEEPRLYLINFNINVGNNGILQFLNPNGWYCFNVKAKVINNFTIESSASEQVAIVSKFAQNDKNFTIVQKP